METVVTERVARRAFAKTFVNEKPRVIQLVRETGFPIRPTPSNGELLSAVDKLMQSNQDFAAKMVEMITRTAFVSNARALEKVGNSGEVDGLTHMFSDIKGKNAVAISNLTGGASYSEAGGNATIAADPISAIAGSIDGVFKRKRSFSRQEENSGAAQQELLKDIMRAEQEKDKKSPSKAAFFIICGGLLALGMAANWKMLNPNSR